MNLPSRFCEIVTVIFKKTMSLASFTSLPSFIQKRAVYTWLSSNSFCSFFFFFLHSVINCTKDGATFYLQLKIRGSPWFISNENHSQSREKENHSLQFSKLWSTFPSQTFPASKRQEKARGLTYSTNSFIGKVAFGLSHGGRIKSSSLMLLCGTILCFSLLILMFLGIKVVFR